MPKVKNISYGLLFVGDIILLYSSLYLTLAIRYVELPGREILLNHSAAFSVLFAVWIVVFFVAGLYDRRTLFLPDSLWQRILKTQIANSVIAIIFFYTIPFFGIAPKTNLFIYLVVSFALLVAWRYWAQSLLRSRNPQKMVLIAGEGVGEKVRRQVAGGGYGIDIAAYIQPSTLSADELYDRAKEVVQSSQISFAVIDMQHPVVQAALPRLYNFLYNNVNFISVDALYEMIFDRVPTERLQHEWFIEHIRQTPHAAYDVLKRGMDIGIAGLLFLLTLPLYPFIMLAIWLQDRKGVFYIHQRVGQFGEPIDVIKFRSMTTADSGEDALNTKGRVTRIGSFLRRTRIDELPQLINVLQGDMSLIGPRPEIPAIVDQYEEEIPYYNARHLIKPGLSGWAQLWHTDPPKFGGEVEKAHKKLAYDLFYVKNRSLLLDIKIALWTVRVLASRSGR